MVEGLASESAVPMESPTPWPYSPRLARTPAPTQLRPLQVRPATLIRHRAQKPVTAALRVGLFSLVSRWPSSTVLIACPVNGSLVDQAKARQEAKRSTPDQGSGPFSEPSALAQLELLHVRIDS